MKQQLIKSLKLNKELITSGLQINEFGNGSIRYKNLCLIKPTGANLNLIKYSDISVIDIVKKKIVSGKKPSVDLDIHLAIYKNYKDIHSIVHTHSLYATSWAQSRRPIPCYGTTHADYYPNDIPITELLNKKNIRKNYEEEIAKSVVNKLKDLKIDPLNIPGMLISNHGVLAWGKSSKDAMKNAIAIEFIAQLAFNSEVINNKIKKLQVTLHKKHYYRKHGPKSYYGQK
jgi:L-ribulose-5-phosphate 4-epimerase